MIWLNETSILLLIDIFYCTFKSRCHLSQAKTLLSHTVSIVFVRHPMARLASVYYQKFIDLGDTSWQGITNRVISLFRVHEDEDPSRVESGFVADNPTYAR